MGFGVVVSHVHRLGLRAPQVKRHGRERLRSSFDEERRRITLPEVVHGHGKSMVGFSNKATSCAASASERANPGRLRSRLGTLANRETFVEKLRKTIAVPRCPIAEITTIAVVESLGVGQGLAEHLLMIHLFGSSTIAVERKGAASGDGLHRFMPKPTFVECECHMTVEGRLP